MASGTLSRVSEILFFSHAGFLVLSYGNKESTVDFKDGKSVRPILQFQDFQQIYLFNLFNVIKHSTN